MSNLLKITVKTWWRILRRGPPWLAQSTTKESTSQISALNQRRSFRMRRTRRNSQSRVLSSTPSPTGGTRAIAPPIWSRRKPMARWLLTRLGSKKEVRTAPFGCPRMSSSIWRGFKWCGFQRRLEAQERLRGIWMLSLQVEVKGQAKEAKLTTWTFVAQVPHKIMVARFQFKHHVASLLLLGCVHALHFLVLLMVGCLYFALTYEQPTWFDKCVERYTRSLLYGTWTSWGMYFICVPWTQAIW